MGWSGRNFEVCVLVSQEVHWVVGSGRERCLTSRGACSVEICSSHRSTLLSLCGPPAGVASLHVSVTSEDAYETRYAAPPRPCARASAVARPVTC